MNWKTFGLGIDAMYMDALEKWLDGHPNCIIHGVAFYAMYAERDGKIFLPELAVLTRAIEPMQDPQKAWWELWGPLEWEPANSELPIDQDQRLLLQESLEKEACKASVAHWDMTYAKFINALVKQLKRFRTEVPKRHPDHVSSSKLLVYIHSEGFDHTWATETLTKAQYKKHFVRAPKPEDLLPEDPQEQAQFLIDKLWVFDGPITSEDAQVRLRELGSEAIGPLIGALDRPKEGHSAARLLGEIGVASPEVLNALRARAEKQLWFALALGVLKDWEWLSKQPESVAVHGFCAPFQSLPTRHLKTPIDLDFRPLENWLSQASPSSIEAVEEELRPGQSVKSICHEEVPEALRALKESPHACVRWCAAGMLDSREVLGSRRQEVLQGLADAWRDEHPWVRRLALLAYQRCRGSLKKVRGELEALVDDEDEVVQREARSMLGV